MRKNILFLTLLTLSVSLIGCASYFKRKECEKTNWFQHGYDRAMSGKRLQGDDFLQQCEKVEAKIDFAAADQGFKAGMGNYCKPQVAYQTGRKGQFFNEGLCDMSGVNKLKAQHAKGVQALCQPGNGHSKGASGWRYNNICPKDLEAGFLTTYNKGRKIYLSGVVAQKRSEIQSLEDQIRDNERRKTEVALRMASIGSTKQVVKTRTFDAAAGRYVESSSVSENEELANQRNRLQSDLRSLDRKIESARSKQAQLRKEIHAVEAEARAL